MPLSKFAIEKRSLDLLADFCTSRNHGVRGRLWVELKVLNEKTFEAEVAACKEELEKGLAREAAKDASLGGVMLLAACVAPCGRSGWAAPQLLATLKKHPSTKWLVLAGGGRRKGRGQCKTTKPSLATIWGKMEWKKEKQQGRKVALLKHFLDALGLPSRNPGQRAKTFNAMLRRRGSEGKVFNGRLENKCGRKPWVASKATFRELYTYV